MNNIKNTNQKDKEEFFIFLMKKPDGSTMRISIFQKFPLETPLVNAKIGMG